jgi:hypothetical protein
MQDETSPNTPKKGNQLLYSDLSHDEQAADSRAPQAPRLKASCGDVVDRIDDPEHAPFAVAAGATKEPRIEGRA